MFLTSNAVWTTSLAAHMLKSKNSGTEISTCGRTALIGTSNDPSLRNTFHILDMINTHEFKFDENIEANIALQVKTITFLITVDNTFMTTGSILKNKIYKYLLLGEILSCHYKPLFPVV